MPSRTKKQRERAIEAQMPVASRVAAWALQDPRVKVDEVWALVIASFDSNDVTPDDTQADWADEVRWARSTLARFKRLGWTVARDVS